MYGSEEWASLAGLPKVLIENPSHSDVGKAADDDVLSDVLLTVRLSEVPSILLHAERRLADGGKGRAQEPGREPVHRDAVSHPGRGDVLVENGGAGIRSGGWRCRRVPVRNRPSAGRRLRRQAGYSGGRLASETVAGNPGSPLWGGAAQGTVALRVSAVRRGKFPPLRNALPPLLHVRTGGADSAGWLRATIEQMVAEVDRPRTGGLSMLERLTEITFIELLRYQIMAAKPGSVGWLAGLADPALGRCLSLIHDEPGREWSVPSLSAASGLSRSTLAERFETMLDTSPMRYLRDWRLCLASVSLSTTAKSIAAIAHEAGYGTEAAFSRAFSRTYGVPPAAWRQNARRGLSKVARGR